MFCKIGVQKNATKFRGKPCGDFLGILFSAGAGEEAQKDILVISEEVFSVLNTILCINTTLCTCKMC